MHYGIQISASGALTAMYRQDVLTNNLTNMDTVGFKPDIPVLRHRADVRAEDGLGFMPSNELLERLGAGVLMAPNRVNWSQGSIETSKNALDMAIRGDGFFVVRDGTDSSGDTLRLTRDGRFTLDAQRRLVMATSGKPVLDVQNQPIVLASTGAVTVGSDGSISQNGEVVARLQVVELPEGGRERLEKMGESLLRAPATVLESRTPARGQVVAGALEQSGVDEIRAMLGISSVAREFESNLNLIQQQDRMLERAVNTLGRVSN
jgi:flagellar basal body rod protein FlgG